MRADHTRKSQALLYNQGYGLCQFLWGVLLPDFFRLGDIRMFSMVERSVGFFCASCAIFHPGTCWRAQSRYWYADFSTVLLMYLQFRNPQHSLCCSNVSNLNTSSTRKKNISYKVNHGLMDPPVTNNVTVHFLN